MKGYLEKLQESGMLIEAICFLLIMTAMLVLLFKIVIPNFGNKSIALGFMTALGSLIILAYTVFMELKPVTHMLEINTFTIFKNGYIQKSAIPTIANYHGAMNLLGSLKQDDKSCGSQSMSNIARELTLVNFAMLLTGDYQDWKKKTSDFIGSQSAVYRSPDAKAPDESTLQFKSLINNLDLEQININFDARPASLPEDFIAIYPPNTKARTTNNSIALENHLTKFKATFITSNSFYMTKGKEAHSTYYVLPIKILIETVEKKRMDGHFRKAEYQHFLSSLTKLFQEQLAVSDSEIPAHSHPAL